LYADLSLRKVLLLSPPLFLPQEFFFFPLLLFCSCRGNLTTVSRPFHPVRSPFFKSMKLSLYGVGVFAFLLVLPGPLSQICFPSIPLRRSPFFDLLAVLPQFFESPLLSDIFPSSSGKKERDGRGHRKGSAPGHGLCADVRSRAAPSFFSAFTAHSSSEVFPSFCTILSFLPWWACFVNGTQEAFTSHFSERSPFLISLLLWSDS